MTPYDAQWAPLDLEQGDLERAFGPLWLRIRRSPEEWEIGVSREGDPGLSSHKPTPSLDIIRFAVRDTASGLAVQPALLDRAVVARPETPVYVLAGETVRLFVSTPIVVSIRMGSSGAVLTEVPTVRLSDTWFGATTRDGELCFASRTGARLSVPDTARTPVRAITAVSITNRSQTHQRIERLKVPCPQLSLYRDPSDALWTEELKLLHAREGERVEPELGRVPAVAGDIARIAAPRRPLEGSAWARSLWAVFA